jgi:beta-glucosidase
VKNWITLNEPFVSALVGYFEGRHAPGIQDLSAALAAAHHLLLAHGQAVPVIRQNCPDSRIGIVLNLTPMEPASSSIADFKQTVWRDGFVNRWFLDPLAGRGYPQDMVESYGLGLPFLKTGDYDTIIAQTDFLGVNYYTRKIIRATNIPEEENEPVAVIRKEPITEMDWEVYPHGLYQTLGRLHFDYRIPEILITENGAAFPDTVEPDGEIRDSLRLDYIKQHLAATHRAIEIGVPVRGYFTWSLFDNFEWGFGYRPRFGIVYVDYWTQKRTPKQSALWYRDAIKQNGFIVEKD